MSHRPETLLNFEYGVASLVLGRREDQMFGFRHGEKKAILDAYSSSLWARIWLMTDQLQFWRGRIIGEGLDRRSFARHTELRHAAVRHLILDHFDQLEDLKPYIQMLVYARRYAGNIKNWRKFKRSNEIGAVWPVRWADHHFWYLEEDGRLRRL